MVHTIWYTLYGFVCMKFKKRQNQSVVIKVSIIVSFGRSTGGSDGGTS